MLHCDRICGFRSARLGRRATHFVCDFTHFALQASKHECTGRLILQQKLSFRAIWLRALSVLEALMYRASSGGG